MALSIPSVAIPSPPGICRAFVILSVHTVEIWQKTSAPGIRHLSVLLEEVNAVPFFTISLKNMNTVVC